MNIVLMKLILASEDDADEVELTRRIEAEVYFRGEADRQKVVEKFEDMCGEMWEFLTKGPFGTVNQQEIREVSRRLTQYDEKLSAHVDREALEKVKTALTALEKSEDKKMESL